MTRYVAQCAGSEEQATKGPAVISPALEKTEVAASLSGFGDHLAKTRFIIWYDIEHERPDLLTVTLLSPQAIATSYETVPERQKLDSKRSLM